MIVVVRRPWADLEDSTRFGLGAWVLIACPLFGLATAWDASTNGWLSGSPAWPYLALLFGVPAVLAIVTGVLARLRTKAILAMVGVALAISTGWALVALIAVGGAAS
jgi:hypothetical protein